jgi:hypothetical protein
MRPRGLPARVFEALTEPEAARRVERANRDPAVMASVYRLRARQTPGLDRTQRERMERMALQIDHIGEVGRTLSRTANARALALVQRLPGALRGLLLTLLRHEPHGSGVCACEAYEWMLRLRQDMRRAQHDEFYRRLSDTLAFWDGQAELRASVHVHQLARYAGMTHGSGEACGGGCGFRLGERI